MKIIGIRANRITRFAITLVLAVIAWAHAAAVKPVWQEADASAANYLSNRRALVGRACVVNQLVNSVGVGSWISDLNNLTDEDLANYATFPKVADVVAGVNPFVSVRDMDNHYAAGTRAGYIMVANSNSTLLSLDVIKTFAVSFYLEGELQGTKKVEQSTVDVLNLSLITIPGSDDPAIELSAVSDWEFDEVTLVPAGGVDAEAVTSAKLRYAFVGSMHENTVTYSSMETYAATHGRLPFTLAQKRAGEDMIDDDLTNGNLGGALINIGALQVTAQYDRTDPDQSQSFKAGSTVGFNYTTASLLSLDAATTVTIKLYSGQWVEKEKAVTHAKYWDFELTEVQSTTVSGTALKLGLVSAGNKDVNIVAQHDFSSAQIILTGLLNVGGTNVHYAYVCDAPEAKHQCDIKLTADVNICASETSYQLANDGSVAVDWSIVDAPAGASPAVDANGLVTGLNAPGQYTVRGTSQADGSCYQDVVITRDAEGFEPDCDEPVVNDGAELYALSDPNYITDSDGGRLLVLNEDIIHPENILNGQTADFATYRGGLSLAENVGIIGVKKLYGKFSSDKPHRIGFIVEMRSTGLNLNAVSLFNIRTYNNGTETSSSVVSESNAVSLGLIGSQRYQKMRFAVTVPAGVEFNEFVLWKSGVLDLDINNLRIYYAFCEEITEEEAASGATSCYNPLGCDGTLVSPETTGATLNATETKNIDVVGVATVIKNLSYLIDDDITTALSVTKTVNVGGGFVAAIDLGRTYTPNHEIGMIVDSKTYLASVDLGNWVTFELYKDGVATGDRQTDWKVLGVNAIGYGDKTYLTMHPTKEFDEIRITYANVVQALSFDTKLYGIFINSDRDGDGIADCRDSDSCADELVLDEEAYTLDKPRARYDNANLVLHRTLYNGVWNPVVLPVDINWLQFRNAFGNSARISAPESLEVIPQAPGSSKLANSIVFKEVEQLDSEDEIALLAGEFYLIMPDEDIIPDIIKGQSYTALNEADGTVNGPIYFIPGVTYVKSEAEQPIENLEISTTGGVSPSRYRAVSGDEQVVVFEGTYVNLDGTVNETIPLNSYQYDTDGWIRATTDDTDEMRGFRFFIKNPTNTDGRPIVYEHEDENGNNVVTGIDGIRSDLIEPTSDPNIYSIDGRILGRIIDRPNLPAGFYIINGKKVYVR